MSLFTNAKKIQDIRPMSKTSIIDYMKEIEKKNSYYIPYSTKYADKVIVNCYFTNGIYQLTVEYDIPTKNEQQPTERIKLVIAEHKERIADFAFVQNQLEEFLKESKNYSIVPIVERYIANIENIGWQFTQEGLDFMLVRKSHGEVEIQKTKYLGEEFDKGVDLDLKKQNHIRRIDEKAIHTLKQYLISTYKKIPNDMSSEIANYKSKMMQYLVSQKLKKDNQNYLLTIIFRETKPMLEETPLVPLMQKSFNQNIEAYIDMIPEEYRDDKIHAYLKEYLQIRLASIFEKEANEGKLNFNSESIKRLEKLDKEYTNLSSQRNALRKRVDFCLGIEATQKGNEEKEAR